MRPRTTLWPAAAVAVAVVAAATVATLAHWSAISDASPPDGAQSTGARRAVSLTAPSFSEVLIGVPGGEAIPAGVALTEADGALPEGATIFDDHLPGIANLDPDLLRAVHDAALDAAEDGVVLFINSGWRSAEYQSRLLQEAVFAYGSEEEAARWVGTPATSAHVSGDAIDIGPDDAAAWLAEHGAEYGLCRTYGNEPWHFELRPQAIGHGCPPTYSDPTHDPRMRE
jgi:zinc D-Ala-D-Ala carboxypeptidase